MDITVLRARIIAIAFMAGLAWSEGSVAKAVDGSRGEKEVEATLSRQYEKGRPARPLDIGKSSRNHHENITARME
jgi:hypothetical protein